MQFKKVVLLSGLPLLVGSIVVPASSSVNWNKTNNATQMQLADGMPLPPVPPSGNTTLLIADGMPLPPLPPAPKGTLLIADGMPLPPLPPSNVDLIGQVA